MSAVRVIQNSQEYTEALTQAGGKLVVVDFTAVWQGFSFNFLPPSFKLLQTSSLSQLDLLFSTSSSSFLNLISSSNFSLVTNP